MKVFVIIMVAFLMQVSASTNAQQLTIKAENISFKEIFMQIRKQTGYTVLAKSNLIKKSRPVNLNLNRVPLETALKQILEGQHLEYAIKDRAIIINEKEPSFLDRVVAVFAAIDVRGIVVDAEGQPLPGATVKVKNTGRSMVANGKGRVLPGKYR